MGEQDDLIIAINLNAGRTADEILILIGSTLLAIDPSLSSPRRAIEEARRFVQAHADRLRVAICASTDPSRWTEVELVAAVAAALADSTTAAVAMLVGIFVARRGADAFCKDLQP